MKLIKRYSKMTQILLWTHTSVFAMNTWASPNCQEVIQAADKALQAKQTELDACYKQVFNNKTQITDLSVTVKQQNDELSSVWHNPLILIPFSILVGGAAVLYLKR